METHTLWHLFIYSGIVIHIPPVYTDVYACVFESIHIYLHIDSRGQEYLRESPFLDLKSSGQEKLSEDPSACPKIVAPDPCYSDFSVSVIPEAEGQERRR